MNKLTKTLAMALVCLFANKIQAQFYLGGQASAMRLPGYGVGMFGLGITGSFMFKEDFPVTIAANFNFPKKYEYQTVLQPLSSAPSGTQPYTKTDKEKLSLFSLMAQYRQYFNDDPESNGAYGIGELGLGMFSYKYTPDIPNSNLYGQTYDINIEESALSYYLSLGIGYQIVTDSDGILHFDAKLSGTDFNFNSRTGLAPQSLPVTLGVFVGYRIPLN